MGEKKRRNENDGGAKRMKIVRSIPMALRDEYCRKANEAMDEAMALGKDPNKWVRAAFEADMVFGVWQDNREPGDVGIAILKGEVVMERILRTKQPERVSQTFIRCESDLQAEAMCITFGDGRAH